MGAPGGDRREVYAVVLASHCLCCVYVGHSDNLVGSVSIVESGNAKDLRGHLLRFEAEPVPSNLFGKPTECHACRFNLRMLDASTSGFLVVFFWPRCHDVGPQAIRNPKPINSGVLLRSDRVSGCSACGQLRAGRNKCSYENLLGDNAHRSGTKTDQARCYYT